MKSCERKFNYWLEWRMKFSKADFLCLKYLCKTPKQCSKISNPIPIKFTTQTLTLRLSFFNRIINLRKICIPVTILKFMCNFEWNLHCMWALSGDDLIYTYLVTSWWIYKADSDFFVKLWLKFACCEDFCWLPYLKSQTKNSVNQLIE